MIGMVAILLLLTGVYTVSNPSVSLPRLKCLNATTTNDCNGAFNGNGTCYAHYTSYYGKETIASERVYSSLGSVVTVAYLVYGCAGALLRTITIFEKATLTRLPKSMYLSLKDITGRMKHVKMEFINNVMIEGRAKRKASLDPQFAKQLKSSYYKRLQQTFVAYSRSFLYRIGDLFFALQ